MKKTILTISFLLVALLLVTLFLSQQNSLQGKWQSDKGDGYGLIEVPGAPFVIEFKKEKIIFKGEEFRIIKRAEQQDGRIFISTEQFVVKLKFQDNGDIVFSFPTLGMRRYKKL